MVQRLSVKFQNAPGANNFVKMLEVRGIAGVAHQWGNEVLAPPIARLIVHSQLPGYISHAIVEVGPGLPGYDHTAQPVNAAPKEVNYDGRFSLC